MKILLTGYKGFIGQNFIYGFNEHELSFFEWGEELPKISGLDWVIHLGAITSTTERDLHKLMEQNYEFTSWLFHECGRYHVNFQYASSASVYGISNSFSESDMPDPKSPYAWSKFLVERYVTKNVSKYPNMIVQGFRYFNVYGPHEDHKGDQASPYHKFRQQAITKKQIILFENSDKYLRDFVPVEKVVDIHKKFLQVKKSGIWNVGTGNPTSFQTIAEQISRDTGAEIKYIPMPENLKNQYQTFTCADLTNLLETLNEESSS